MFSIILAAAGELDLSRSSADIFWKGLPRIILNYEKINTHQLETHKSISAKNIETFQKEIEREREVHTNLIKTQQAHHDTQTDKLIDSHDANVDKLVGEFRATKDMLEKRADSWKDTMTDVKNAVDNSTTTLQAEMVKNREALVERAQKIHERHSG